MPKKLKIGPARPLLDKMAKKAYGNATKKQKKAK